MPYWHIDAFLHTHSTYKVECAHQVWSTGLNKEGQLGLGHAENVAYFTRIDVPSSLSFPVRLAAGSSHSVRASIRV